MNQLADLVLAKLDRRLTIDGVSDNWPTPHGDICFRVVTALPVYFRDLPNDLDENLPRWDGEFATDLPAHKLENWASTVGLVVVHMVDNHIAINTTTVMRNFRRYCPDVKVKACELLNGYVPKTPQTDWSGIAQILAFKLIFDLQNPNSIPDVVDTVVTNAHQMLELLEPYLP